MKPSETTRYSEAFKQQVVNELAAGKFRGVFAAGKAYGIRGSETIQSWLRRYGRTDLMPRRVTITTMKEQDEKKALKERVRQLEKALADSHMRGILEEEYLKIACRRLGVEVTDFKKKHVTTLSEGPGAEPR
jgi:transposase-like protein